MSSSASLFCWYINRPAQNLLLPITYTTPSLLCPFQTIYAATQKRTKCKHGTRVFPMAVSYDTNVTRNSFPDDIPDTIMDFEWEFKIHETKLLTNVVNKRQEIAYNMLMFRAL